jgi:hypothetical protein
MQRSLSSGVSLVGVEDTALSSIGIGPVFDVITPGALTIHILVTMGLGRLYSFSITHEIFEVCIVGRT